MTCRKDRDVENEIKMKLVKPNEKCAMTLEDITCIIGGKGEDVLE